MRDESGAWEAEYMGKGPLWGGAVYHLPLLPPGSRVLELGCGNGKTLSAMIQRGWDVTAIDLSARAAVMSRMNVIKQQKGEVCVADARNLPFASDRFDAVIAVHLFSHLAMNDRRSTAAEAVRVLKKQGILYFSGFSVLDFRAGKGLAVEEGTVKRGSGICTHYFTEPETQQLFCNLTVKTVTTAQWSMRVRGHDYPRAEVQATFIK